jgi:multiple sugar transport system permease protein
MAKFSETGPRSPVVESIRVDKVSPRYRTGHNLRAIIAWAFALIGLIPVMVMIITAFKTRQDIVSIPPKVIFKPTLEGFVYLLTDRVQISAAEKDQRQADIQNLSWMDRVVLKSGQKINGPSEFAGTLKNSLIIAGLSTILAVGLGLFAAYAFSRFNVLGKNDLLFFILSTRMLPAVVVTIPLFLMYRQLKLYDTYTGMTLLYTVFSLSLVVWLLKGFIDEIPKEYEEAALIDGYSRMQAFYKIVLPQAITGIAATTVFVLIFAWNEYGFALMMTSQRARTAPPGIATMLGVGGIEWSAIAAGALIFLIPVVIVTFALRKFLLRGVTFGAIRQ